ncbi:unnamed protein product [Gadus morhua 'NCC']
MIDTDISLPIALALALATVCAHANGGQASAIMLIAAAAAAAHVEGSAVVNCGAISQVKLYLNGGQGRAPKRPGTRGAPRYGERGAHRVGTATGRGPEHRLCTCPPERLPRPLPRP